MQSYILNYFIHKLFYKYLFLTYFLRQQNNLESNIIIIVSIGIGIPMEFL